MQASTVAGSNVPNSMVLGVDEEPAEPRDPVHASVRPCARRCSPVHAPVEFRFVTFDELLRYGMPHTTKGPRPRHEVMRLANAIAHDRLKGSMQSVRSVANATGCCTVSGGDRTRATRYAAIIEELLVTESEGGSRVPTTGDERATAPQNSSLPPSPPMSPALPTGAASGWAHGAWIRATFLFAEADKQATRARALGGPASTTLVVQLGWALLISGLLPFGCQYAYHEWASSTFGSYGIRFTHLAPLLPIGGITMGLGVAPHDAWTIVATVRAVTCLYVLLSILCFVTAAHYCQRFALDTLDPAWRPWPYAGLYSSWVPLNFVAALMMVERSRALHAQPEKLLRAGWAVGRFLCCTAGLSLFAAGGCLLFIDPVSNLNDPYAPSAAATALSFTACGALATPSARDRATRLLAGSSSGKHAGKRALCSGSAPLPSASAGRSTRSKEVTLL